MKSRFYHNGLGAIEEEACVQQDGVLWLGDQCGTQHPDGNGSSDNNGGATGGNGQGHGDGTDGTNEDEEDEQSSNDESTKTVSQDELLALFQALNANTRKQAETLGIEEFYEKYKMPLAVGFGGLLLIAILK